MKEIECAHVQSLPLTLVRFLSASPDSPRPDLPRHQEQEQRNSERCPEKCAQNYKQFSVDTFSPPVKIEGVPPRQCAGAKLDYKYLVPTEGHESTYDEVRMRTVCGREESVDGRSHRVHCCRSHDVVVKCESITHYIYRFRARPRLFLLCRRPRGKNDLS